MRFYIFLFFLLLYSVIFSLDSKTEKRLEKIEKRIEELEKKIDSLSVQKGSQETAFEYESSLPETTGEELLIKENLLKAKISSLKTLSGKKKKGLLLDVTIYNPTKYKIKIFTGDLLFYAPSGDLILSYKAYDDKELLPGKRTIFPVLVDIEKSEAYFYFVKHKTSRLSFTNQKLVADQV